MQKKSKIQTKAGLKWFSYRLQRIAGKDPSVIHVLANFKQYLKYRLGNSSFCLFQETEARDILFLFTRKQKRNKNCASYLLKKVLRNTKQKVFAQVASNNIPSLSVFLKYGFRFNRKLFGYHGAFPSYELVYEPKRLKS